MSSLFYVFSRPLFYIFIKDPSGDKKWIDWILPICTTFLLFILLYLSDANPVIIGENGVLQNLKGFLQIMPGFYLTALAAVATFSNKNLDLLLPKPAPTINIMYNGNKINGLELTRRRFLNYLFSYLTTISLFLYFSIIIAEIYVGAKITSYTFFQMWIKPLLLFIYATFIWQMLFITIFGLYQLCERIHQIEQDDVNGKEN